MRHQKNRLIIAAFCLLALVLIGASSQDRKLLMGAGGPSAAFSPTSIAGLQLWLKADAITGLNDGDAVATWTDQSGQGNDVDIATEALRPIYKTGIVNSKPIVRFNGTTQYLRRTSMNNGGATSAVSIFAVATGSSTSSGDLITLEPGSGNTVYELRIDSTSNVVWRPYNTSGSACERTKAQVGTFWVASALRSASLESILYVNGSGTSASTGCGTQRTGSTAIWIGQFGFNFNYFGGDVAELLLYDSALGDTDRQAVQTYLTTKYGL